MSSFKPELLAPAGNMDKLHTCLLYGADAVYLGGKTGNLRAACEGFSPVELREAVRLAEKQSARIYYCLNSLPMERDLPALPAQIEDAAGAGVHGFIIADPGVLRLAARYAPGVETHLSTQANNSNSEALAFWAEQGVCRANLARELCARDIHAIRRACPDMELEVFVHGAMCLAVSGQCLLSVWLNNRSGNQGRCTQPCRFEYKARASAMPEALPGLVVEEYTRPGEALWRVEQDEGYSSFWAPQDLCLLPWMPWFMRNRIDSLKIEGRMKSAGWLAHVVDTYRACLDALRAGAGMEAGKDAWMRELLYAATRPLGSGFFLGGGRRNLTEEFLRRTGVGARPNRSGEAAVPVLGRALLARVLGQKQPGVWELELRGDWRQAADIELMLPGFKRPVLPGNSYGLENARGELCSVLGNGTRGLLYADAPELGPGIFIRAAE